MLIRDLFLSNVTRDIPPVVYFHEQSADKLEAEVSEYIITGGWPENHPNHKRVPMGIHEQYARLLNNIAADLEDSSGLDLPTVWISGFYGSGKSSFAKLLGLALDGRALPDGSSLAEAWLRRDTSPKAAELREAWKNLRQKIDPAAVVFDIGAFARDNEHIHAASVRQVQERLGYCSQEPLVAKFELKLELEGDWAKFEKTAAEVLEMPWSEAKDTEFADEDFSLVLSKLYPDRFPEPQSWVMSRGGTQTTSQSPQESVEAIRDMLEFRAPDSTLFLVIDEVSQYVLSKKDRVDRLRAFASALGSTLRGKVWLMALGQQKLEEEADESFLVWAKDRFPPKFRVHLASTNIRDVVHKRLLQKKPEMQPQLRDLFEKHRQDLKLFAYGCESITVEEFVEVYPMLPGHIDLILQITSALRTRSARAQGDDQAIRGLLQLLGELFRDQELAEQEVGRLVTLDQVYEIQHTALDSDTQDSMTRILARCTEEEDELMVRAAKAVALLELVQETIPTDAKLVARCLYDRIDRGNHVPAVTEALEELRARNLLGYSEKQGYKIQSSAAEEWERERGDLGAGREAISAIVMEDGLEYLLGILERPRLQGRSFPWAGRFSDGRRYEDEVLVDPRDDAALMADFRFLSQDERTESTWVKRSKESTFENRLIWVGGDSDKAEQLARELHRSRVMVGKYEPRRASLNPKRKILLQEEQNRVEDLQAKVRDAVASAWMNGKMYFRSSVYEPAKHGSSFRAALEDVGTKVLRDLFRHFDATQVQPSELSQLLESEISGASPKFMPGALGILDLDSGRYVPVCSGVVPVRVKDHIEAEGGVSGSTLLSHFGGPPYGYTPNVVKACVAGLLRASKIKMQPEGQSEITAVRDAGVRELFERDRTFRRAMILPAGEDDIGFQARARICQFFEERLDYRIDREDHQIADAVGNLFPTQSKRLRRVQERLSRLPGSPRGPEPLKRLGEALEECVARHRHTKPTVQLVKKNLDVLRDGIQLLQVYDAELTDSAIDNVRKADERLRFETAQLRESEALNSELEDTARRVEKQLATERPWVEISTINDDLREIRDAYLTERQRRLQWQEEETEQARARIRSRAGFSTVTSEQSHRVLKPLAEAATNTSAEAVAPSLRDLEDPFILRLQRAEEEANELLDKILSEGDKPMIQPIDLGLRNREIADEQDIEALLDEIRERLLEVVRAGARARLK